MGINVDPSIVGRVIGDVVDMFIPSVAMSVYYHNKHVTSGCHVIPSSTVDPPRIFISGHATHLYTLVMTDPDAPSPSEPTMREWIHWIVTDIPGSGNISRGKEVVPYVKLEPPVGIHRYILVLFQQQRGSSLGDIIHTPICRSHFNTRAFAHQFRLGRPVAIVYFNSKKQPANRN